MTETVFLVRHGAYRIGAGLSAEGIEDATRAKDQLLAKNLGGNAMVLSSTAPRAIETAEIIADGLMAGIVPSLRIKEGGNGPQAIQDLDAWIGLAFDEAKLSTPDDKRLVIVTHAPMVAIAKGLHATDTSSVGYGEVYEYTPGSWSNPDYDKDIEGMIEATIARANSPTRST